MHRFLYTYSFFILLILSLGSSIGEASTSWTALPTNSDYLSRLSLITNESGALTAKKYEGGTLQNLPEFVDLTPIEFASMTLAPSGTFYAAYAEE